MRILRKKPVDFLLFLLTWIAAGITFVVLLFLIGHILINGVPHIRPSLFEWVYTSQNLSLMPAFMTTLIVVGLALLITIPFGVFSAVYLVEYAKRGSKFVAAVRMTTETLAGIPSIVYGLFGFLFFVVQLNMGYSVLAGSATLSIMILPLIMRTTEESLKSVPDTYREGAFGLGAGRLRTLFAIVLPAAMPGILAGVILGVGRIVGETAALLHTAGSFTGLPQSLTASGRTLSVHMYALANEGLHIGPAYATAVVLVILVVGINTLSAFVAKRLTKR